MFDRSLILMVSLLTPYTTISVLILSGLLKITGKEHVYQFTSKPDIWDIPVPCPSTAGRNPENFLIIIICFCLCSAGQICLECFKGMLIKPHVKMPGDQLHLWAAPQLSHHHPLQPPPKSCCSNVARAQISFPRWWKSWPWQIAKCRKGLANMNTAWEHCILSALLLESCVSLCFPLSSTGL